MNSNIIGAKIQTIFDMTKYLTTFYSLMRYCVFGVCCNVACCNVAISTLHHPNEERVRYYFNVMINKIINYIFYFAIILLIATLQHCNMQHCNTEA